MENVTATKALFVDASPHYRKAGAALLRDLGFSEFMMATNGTEAWSLIKSYNIDFVISSWQLLPEMSGLVLLKVVRADAAFSATSFLLVVDEITKSQVIAAGEAGVTDIIIRPFTRDIFKRKVDGALKGDEDPQAKESRKLMDQGQELLKQGRYDEALNSFKRILNISESAEVYYNLGYIKTAQGKYEEAIAAFRKATQINNAFARAYQKMGEVYAKLGREEEAQKCLELAAEIYMDKNMDENAEQIYMQALQINPKTLNIYNSLGILYRRQGKFNEAIKMYRKARRVNPYDEHIYYNMARVFMSLNELKDAAKCLTRAVELNPDFSEARQLLKSIRLGEAM
ncbi:MAG: tetratricopeptide repeat protein [Pseudomonadota bacterium]